MQAQLGAIKGKQVSCPDSAAVGLAHSCWQGFLPATCGQSFPSRQVWIENLSNTNPGGTMVNGEAVQGRHVLKDADVIEICGRAFRFACKLHLRPMPMPRLQRTELLHLLSRFQACSKCKRSRQRPPRQRPLRWARHQSQCRCAFLHEIWSNTASCKASHV